jgi:Peptidase family M28
MARRNRPNRSASRRPPSAPSLDRTPPRKAPGIATLTIPPSSPWWRRLWPWIAAVALVAVACSAGSVAIRSATGRLGVRPEFDGTAAYARLRAQCDFGPRVPGTPGHAKCLEYLVKTLKESTPDVERQEFNFDDRGKPLPMVNVIGKFGGGSGPATLLAAHWDTRPTADQELDPARKSQPISGANDGASGVAVLLELAHQFKQSPPPGPVWIVFFDGEDLGPGEDRMYLGARYFADHLPPGTPKQGVLLDMIGDRDLQIYQETNSIRRAGDVVKGIWETARRLGYQRNFPPQAKFQVGDDHIPLQDKGLEIADLIDFDYPPWHTLADTVDKCSAESLQIVGRVVGAWVYSRSANEGVKG